MKQKGKIVNFIDVCRYFPIYFFAKENQKHLKFFTDYQKLKKRRKRHSPPEEFAKRKKIILSRQLVSHRLQQNKMQRRSS